MTRDSESLLLLLTVLQSTLSEAPLSRCRGYRLSPVLSPAPGDRRADTTGRVLGRRWQGSPSGQFKPGQALPRRGPGRRSPGNPRRLEKERRPRNWNCVRSCTLAQEPSSLPLLSPNFPETPKSKHCRTSRQRQRDGSGWKRQPHGAFVTARDPAS